MKFAAFLFFSLCSFYTYAQVDVNRFTNIIQSVSSGGASYGAGFKGMAGPAGKIKGDPYLDSAFLQSSFKFNGQNSRISLKAPARYDLINNEIEVKTTAGIRVIKTDLIKSYKSLKGEDSVLFVNASNYKLEETKLIGFLQVLSDGNNAQLLKQVRLEISKPSYNASVDVGDKDTHLVKKEALFFAIGDQLYKMKSKKELLQIFGDKKEEVATYADSNNLGFKKEEDLIEIFTFYNGLKS